MQRIIIVSTCNQEGFKVYGQNFITSFIKYWPANYQLWMYTENFEINPKSERIHIINLIKESPKLNLFKQKWGQNQAAHGIINNQYNYAFDAIRFAHKIFAYTHAAKHLTSSYMAWLDADTITHNYIPEQLIPNMFINKEVFLAYLGRIGFHSETGFIAFNLQHPCQQEFFSTIENLYNFGEIFNLQSWNDSIAFDSVRTVMTAQSKFTSLNLSKNIPSMHPFVNSILGKYMDHLKGPKRKQMGHSFNEDYIKS